MPINFIPNDPEDTQMSLAQIQPSAAPAANRVGFDQAGLPAEAVHAVGTDDFVAWQAREAALRAVAVFEGIHGALPGWRGNPQVKRIRLVPNDGDDLNAYYNRDALLFYKTLISGRQLYSGASTEVVAHEAGHAILDALRPDLWNTMMLEVAAFHEGFGDCIALMTVLSDVNTRTKLLSVDPNLTNPNFVEAMGEELSWGIAKRAGPNHNAAQPRRAFNTLQWNLPDQLPANGGPGVLIREAHSLGQLLSGCYYDIIRGLFSGSALDEAALWKSCEVATYLLAEAVAKAPIKPRFLEAVGRTMLVVDQEKYQGANAAVIRAAYANHNLAVSATTFLAPRATLGPSAPTVAASGAVTLGAGARRRVKEMMSAAPNAKMSLAAFDVGGNVLTAQTEQDVDLTGISERLENVVARTPYSAFVGDVQGRAALMGAVEAPAAVDMEVRSYVEMLVKRHAVAFDGAPRRTRKKGAGYVASTTIPTHVIRKRGGKEVLERRAFVCACHAVRWPSVG